jgi:signal transduction histidine kinase
MLKQRFLLAFLPLPLLFLSAGFYAVYVLADLEVSIKEIVDANLNSVIAAEKMQDGVQRMSQGVALSLQSADQEAAAAFRTGVTNFEHNLKAQFDFISSPGESNLTRRVESSFETMRSSGRAVLDAPPGQRVFQAAPFFASKEKVQMLTEELRLLNRDAMRSGVAEVEHTRQSSTVFLVLMMLISTLLWLLVSARLAEAIRRPIRALIHAIQTAGEHKRAPTVSRFSPDEVGMLVQEFNKMSTRLETYRNSTTAKVLRAQRILQATLAAMPDPVYVVNQDLQVELKNASANRIDDLGTGKALPPQLVERARQVMAEGQDYLPRRFQDALVRDVEGEPRYFLPKVLIMRDEQQRPLGAAIALTDVTQFRLLDELKSNFVSTVSHEIKTPLTSIRMAVHLLQEETAGPLQPRQAALLKTAREDIERLLRLLNNLLDVAGFEHGLPQMYWEQTSVCGLIEEAVNEVKTLAESRKLTLKVECPDGLPDLYIDRARVSHVLRNLLTNAIKHSPEGDEILLSVTLAENGGIQFAVRDRGSGIPEEYRERIFERFFRVPGQKTAGTGLGLSIAREIIMAHTGTIGCQSEPGRQTTFHFCLPTATEHQRRLAAADSSRAK